MNLSKKRKKVVIIKNLVKVILILLIIYTPNTYAYFTTKTSINNTLQTINYNFNINSNEGTFVNTDIIIKSNKVTLPISEKEGYNFIGYKVNNNTYNNRIDLSIINNQTVYATYEPINYNITYDLNGGVINNLKETYNTEEEFILPNPEKEGYTFIGWTGSNGSIPEKNLKINKGTINDLEFIANYTENKANITVIPTVDNVEYNDGYSDYTFDVYINDSLIEDDITTWKDKLNIGDKIRIKANDLPGRTTTYDETIIIENNNDLYMYPSWIINSYDSDFYFNNNLITTTTNKYQTPVLLPTLQANQLGYNDSFYYIKEYSPTESSIQLDKTLRFNIIIDERMCYTSFGNATLENSINQLSIINSRGYNFCNLTDWNSVECTEKYSTALNLYNNIWNILPRTGNGYSVYKQIYCDSGWYITERR